jgi:hypothetical protein
LLQVGSGQKISCDIGAMNTSIRPLGNKLILLIEADSFLASYIGDSIKGDGAQILGPARTVNEANALIGNLRQPPHAAVVSADIFEAGGPAMKDAFARLGVPLLLTLKRSRELLPSSANHDLLIAPFAAYQVVHHLRAVVTQGDQPSLHLSGPTLRGH